VIPVVRSPRCSCPWEEVAGGGRRKTSGIEFHRI
jgi:hypothetical protein